MQGTSVVNPRSAHQVENHFREVNRKFPRKLGLYISRFNFLTEFGTLSLGKISNITSLGYEFGLRIGLADTAIESIESGLICSKNQLVIKDVATSRILRSLRGTKFEEFLISSCKTINLRDSVIAMFKSQNTANLRPAISAIRNAVFHGSYTPNSIGFTVNADVRLFMENLYFLVIDQLEHEFDKFAIALISKNLSDSNK